MSLDFDGSNRFIDRTHLRYTIFVMLKKSFPTKKLKKLQKCINQIGTPVNLFRNSLKFVISQTRLFETHNSYQQRITFSLLKLFV